LAASVTSAATDQDRLVSAHQTMLGTSGLQHSFSPLPATPPPPPWLLSLLEALKDAAPVFSYIFWGAVIIGAVLILWVLVRDLPFAERLWRRRPKAAATDWRPDATTARALLEEADRLAKAGRFDEAIHLLLFRSIEEIAAKRPSAVRAAFTSREIVETAPLSESGRLAFRHITEAVERSLFAGRSAGAEEFHRCRGQYETFALAESGAAGR